MTITEKSAYLRGLVEGLNIDSESKEGKIFKCMVDIIDDMAITIADLEDSAASLTEEIDDLYEELDELYEDMDEMYEEDDLCEIQCPECGVIDLINEFICDDGVIECPNCGKQFDIDLDCDEECGCDCGCHDDSEDN